MKLRKTITSTMCYPQLKPLIVGSVMGAALALSGCAGSKEKTSPDKGDPVLPAKAPGGTSVNTQPQDPKPPVTTTTSQDTTDPATTASGALDTDKDGTPDKDDHCPKIRGPKYNKGCPVKRRGIMIRPRHP